MDILLSLSYYRASLQSWRICVAVHVWSVWTEIQENNTHEMKTSCDWFPCCDFRQTVWKFAEPHIYRQQQKCSTGTLVSGDISFMGLFTGVP